MMMRRFVSILTVLLVILGLGNVAWSALAWAGDGENSKGLSVSYVGSASIWTDRSSYHIGDDVRIKFRSSETGYAVIYDYSEDGRSQVVWPSNGSPQLVQAGRTYSLPQGRDRITASEPAGTDTLVLVVSPARTTFTGHIDLSFYVGGPESRGVSVGGGGHDVTDGSFSAQCSFEVVRRTLAPSGSVQVQTSGVGAALMLGGLLLLLAGAVALAP